MPTGLKLLGQTEPHELNAKAYAMCTKQKIVFPFCRKKQLPLRYSPKRCYLNSKRNAYKRIEIAYFLRTALCIKIVHRVPSLPVLPNLKMQMVARAVPRTAHIADDLSLLHLLSGCDTDAGTVGVQRVKRSVMLYLYAISGRSHLRLSPCRPLPQEPACHTARQYPCRCGRIFRP